MTATTLLVELLGAVALLIWAVRMIRTGITRALGGRLHNLIDRAAGNRLQAFGSGLVATVLVQSSVAVAMIVSSLSSRGAIALVPGLAVLLGADVGSTMAVQLVAFDLRALSPLCIFLGVVLFMSADGGGRRHLGRFAIGIGLLLLALAMLKTASLPLRESAALSAVLAALDGAPLIALLLAAVLTWLAHSSLAVILLVMSLYVTGVVSLETAIALVLGANVGSGLVPVIATLAAPAPARRVPIGNFTLRCVGALAAVAMTVYIPPWLAPFESDPARQIAIFHTAFNVALVLAFLPFLGPLAKGLQWLLPEPDRTEDPASPRHLDDDAVSDPSTALASASREALRMADTAEEMLRQARDFLFTGDDRLLHRLATGERVLDHLHRSIKLYLIKLQTEEMDEREGSRQLEIMTLVTNLEHLGDIIDHNLIDAGKARRRLQIQFTPTERKEVERVYEMVEQDMRLAASVFMTRDVAMARRLVTHKSVLRKIEQQASDNQLRRLGKSGGPASSLHLDAIRDLKRLHSHIASIAYPLLEAEGILASSRLIAATDDRQVLEEGKRTGA